MLKVSISPVAQDEQYYCGVLTCFEEWHDLFLEPVENDAGLRRRESANLGTVSGGWLRRRSRCRGLRYTCSLWRQRTEKKKCVRYHRRGENSIVVRSYFAAITLVSRVLYLRAITYLHYFFVERGGRDHQ